MKKKTIVIAGSVATQSGYGSHSRDIARALIKSDKYDVKIIAIRWGSTPQNALDPNEPDDKMILDRIIPGTMNEQPDIFIHITIPNEFQRAGKYNIGITAGIETTACRVEWIEGCNRMDLVLATSEHSKHVFEISRFEKRDSTTQQILEIVELTRPVQVLFEGVDLDVYNKRIDPKSVLTETLNNIPEDFCFLFVGHWLQGDFGHDRKDVGRLIHTFMETFKRKNKRNRPALILKTSQAGFSRVERTQIMEKISDIRAMIKADGWTGELPNVYVLHGSLSDHEMNYLYNHTKVKAMVSLTKGEGFGRPLLEFTTSGKPVIASGWSGQIDFLHPEYTILLPGNLGAVHPSATNDWIIDGSQWFTANYQIAAQKMLDVHRQYDSALERAKLQRKHTVNNFSFEKMISKLCEYVDQIDTYAQLTRKPSTPQAAVIPQQVKLNLPKLKMSTDAEPPTKISLPKLTRVEL